MDELQRAGAIVAMDEVEHADAGGICDEGMLRGDEIIVRERRQRADAGSRARAAVQAELDKIKVQSNVPIAAATLRKEREAVAARGAIVPKTQRRIGEYNMHSTFREANPQSAAWRSSMRWTVLPSNIDPT